jgi:molybdopterin/thiamine biosynthesis adenylyltransferase
MSIATPTEAELLESQKQRYDRQIRVWGAGSIYMFKYSNSYIHGQIFLNTFIH